MQKLSSNPTVRRTTQGQGLSACDFSYLVGKLSAAYGKESHFGRLIRTRYEGSEDIMEMTAPDSKEYAPFARRENLWIITDALNALQGMADKRGIIRDVWREAFMVSLGMHSERPIHQRPRESSELRLNHKHRARSRRAKWKRIAKHYQPLGKPNRVELSLLTNRSKARKVVNPSVLESLLHHVYTVKRIYDNEYHKHIVCTTDHCSICFELSMHVRISRCSKYHRSDACHVTGYYPHIGWELWLVYKEKHEWRIPLELAKNDDHLRRTLREREILMGTSRVISSSDSSGDEDNPSTTSTPESSYGLTTVSDIMSDSD